MKQENEILKRKFANNQIEISSHQVNFHLVRFKLLYLTWLKEFTSRVFLRFNKSKALKRLSSILIYNFQDPKDLLVHRLSRSVNFT